MVTAFVSTDVTVSLTQALYSAEEGALAVVCIELAGALGREVVVTLSAETLGGDTAAGITS